MNRGFLAGLVATLAAGALMALFRLGLGVLTVPEVLAEGAIFLVPLDIFSAVVEALGAWAKRLLVVGLAVVLLAAGGGGGVLWGWLSGHWPWLGSGKNWWAGAGVGLGLWLLVMAVMLPLSSRGFFGVAASPWPVGMALVWLLASLVYGLVLVGWYSRPEAPADVTEAGTDTTRRWLLKRLAYSVVGLTVAGGVGVGIWRYVSGLSRRMVATLSMGKLPPEVTPNEDFYKVSKNLFLDPVVEAASWQLEITGLVKRNLVMNYQQLQLLPATTQYLTVECISNWVGGSQIGNARWKGVPLGELLTRAGVKDTVRKVVLYCADNYSDSITLDKAMEAGTVLAYEMNGVPLPDGHGFPVRLLVPGIYGMKNVKWLTRIELVDYDYQGYWQRRDWSDEAIIKTMSRIDVPEREGTARLSDLAPLAVLGDAEAGRTFGLKVDGDSAGQAMLGGIAFAGDRGISWVEVSTDNGRTWHRAQVKKALSPYTWVLWVYRWRQPAAGEYTIKVRAADSQGTPQSATETRSLPDGASGYHTLVVNLNPD